MNEEVASRQWILSLHGDGLTIASRSYAVALPL